MAYGKAKALIFDFNGTLLFDTEAHSDAWRTFLLRHGRAVSDGEMAAYVQGRPNADILGHFFGPLPAEEVRRMADEKEAVYRALCLRTESAGWYRLAPGVEALFDRLKAEGFPFTIATSSGWDNVSFYFATLGLGRWFTPETIIFDDGHTPGKPAPDIYLRAMKLLGVAPSDTAVFEDSVSGIRAGIAAGAGWVVGIDSSLPAGRLRQEGACGVVHDFTGDWARMLE